MLPTRPLCLSGRLARLESPRSVFLHSGRSRLHSDAFSSLFSLFLESPTRPGVSNTSVLLPAGSPVKFVCPVLPVVDGLVLHRALFQCRVICLAWEPV